MEDNKYRDSEQLVISISELLDTIDSKELEDVKQKVLVRKQEIIKDKEDNKDDK